MSDPLKVLFTQYWLYLAVRASCKLNLFEVVRDQRTTETELHERLETHPQATQQLLGALVHHGFLKSEGGWLQLTSLSERLTADHPLSMKHACLLWGGEHMDVWQSLDGTLRSGNPVFMEMFGLPFFEYLGINPVRSTEYHRAMFEYARDDYNGIAQKLGLVGADHILDVGGANGALALEIRKTYPGKRVTIFDIEDRRHETAQGINILIGDFFTGIPEMADTILLSRVIHDWPDDKATSILSNCTRSLPSGGRLFLIENDLGKIKDGGHLLSLNMMAVCESFERTEQQYSELLRSVGLMPASTTNHNHLIIIEAQKS